MSSPQAAADAGAQPSKAKGGKTKSAKKSPNAKESSHYVVTAHPPGGVLCSAKCNFLAPDSEDVIIAKSRRLEIRQLRSQNGNGGADEDDSAAPFPVILSLPINGRITSLMPLTQPGAGAGVASSLFFITDQMQYAVIAYDANVSPYPVVTLSSGNLDSDEWSMRGRKAECGPLVAIDPHMRCLVLHLHDGLLTVFRIIQPGAPVAQYRSGAAKRSATTSTSSHPVLALPFHARIEERTVLALTLLHHSDSLHTPPHVCLLHQDSRGAQHISTHAVDLPKSQLWFASGSSSTSPPSTCEWLKRSRIDGGSSILIPVAPRAAAAAAASVAAAAAPSSSNDPAVAPTESKSGGVVILGQRQITYCSWSLFKVMPIPPALILSWDILPPDNSSGMPRYLLGDEFGNLHMLTLLTASTSPSAVLRVIGLQLDTLGSCTLGSTLEYLGQGIVYVGATLGDSQLVQIHDEPIPVDDGGVELGDTTYLSVIEEYTNLGPIVDFDLVPTTPGGQKGMAAGSVHQSQVVTASGSSKSGSLRIVRNGIGMNEYACVAMSGIQHMWSLRKTFAAPHDAYLVQSFVGETRVLGVTSTGGSNVEDEDAVMQGDSGLGEGAEEAGGTLEEVFLPGLESNASTLYVGNVIGDLFLQITESELRLASNLGEMLDTWSPSSSMNDTSSSLITVAAANEAGQIAIALRGGLVTYFYIQNHKLVQVGQKKMDREVSCMNLNPFTSDDSTVVDLGTAAMQVEGDTDTIPVRVTHQSSLVAIGLWDDFTVRILSLEPSGLLKELLQIHLSTTDDDIDSDREDDSAKEQRRNRNNMMARSLCLVTLDYSSSSTATSAVENNIPTAMTKTAQPNPGVDMLFVGLGDGTVVSFAVMQSKEDGPALNVQSKKEVSLGTQRISLVPLRTERGGTCILATGDRPTVIYLAGVGSTSSGQNYNPKLCYSNVNLSSSDDDADPDLNATDVSRGHSQQTISVNVAAPFFSPLLFDVGGDYSLCVADDENLRLGVIDDIQKLHVTTCLLGMAPRRVVHCSDGRLYAVGCVESGIKQAGMGGNEMNMGNCIRFLDETTFEDIERIDMDPFEIIVSMLSASIRFYPPSIKSTDVAGAVLGVDNSGADISSEYHQFLFVGTAYALPDEDEPNKGRILVYSCDVEDGVAAGSTSRTIRLISELQVRGGVYSMSQFFNGHILVSVNSKTQICQLTKDATGFIKPSMVGVGHHGHILSLFVKSRAEKTFGVIPNVPDSLENDLGESKKGEEDEVNDEQLAIVGDLMRSISLVQYYPQYETLEEIARDFNTNWTTAIEMLTDDIYIGCENWCNLFVLRRNTKSTSEEVRCRLDTVGQFYLGEMCNKFMRGSLIMPYGPSTTATTTTSKGKRSIASPSKPPSSQDFNGNPPSPSKPAALTTITTRSHRPTVAVGSQTLFGTVDGTLGVMLGMDRPTAAFFTTLERAMAQVIKPVGDLMHYEYRAVDKRPAYGFVDGDLVEAFLDLDRTLMELVVDEMNRDGGWEADDAAYAAAKAMTKQPTTADRMDTSDAAAATASSNALELSVEDVLAVVEEMAMLH